MEKRRYSSLKSYRWRKVEVSNQSHVPAASPCVCRSASLDAMKDQTVSAPAVNRTQFPDAWPMASLLYLGNRERNKTETDQSVNEQKDRQCTYDVTLRRVRIILVPLRPFLQPDNISI
jgi:hypothetical protein